MVMAKKTGIFRKRERCGRHYKRKAVNIMANKKSVGLGMAVLAAGAGAAAVAVKNHKKAETAAVRKRKAAEDLLFKRQL